ncbi:hypothetical protein EVAR_43197_1 [Eumeta japonica]|uniref:Uncharacterized protein n=1 Tax=Eumeta variegata TaxID=151549 RepID=A0A4C1WU80_EUMVA|nr:hypothetical protein EVAR_43197_1 [Eumeta japonica]
MLGGRRGGRPAPARFGVSVAGPTCVSLLVHINESSVIRLPDSTSDGRHRLSPGNALKRTEWARARGLTEPIEESHYPLPSGSIIG